MRSLIAYCTFTMMLTATLPAAYTNLIATSDGKTTYFQIGTGWAAGRWFVAREATSNRVVEAVSEQLADVSGAGAVLASANFSEKYCGFAGSTCFIAPPCLAGLEIKGPGIQVAGSQRRTLVRLDRQGALAWIDQDTPCPGFGMPAPAPLNGLYESATLRQIAPANGARLGNQRYGRRVIDDRGRVLVFVGIQMSWLDATVRAIRHVAAAFEAVVDKSGQNIVYVEAPFGKLHWIAADDEDLGITGSAPAISEDGSKLAFLAADNSLRVYDRGSRTVHRIGNDVCSSFSLGGNDVFAVTLGNRLVRIDLASESQTTWVEPFPEIESADAPPLGISFVCPLVCYGKPDLGLVLARGMLLVLRGQFLDRPGWRARSAGVDFPLHIMSDTAAWVQIPSDLPATGVIQTLEIFHPDYPLVVSESTHLQDRVAICFGAFHQDFSRIVTPSDPAAPFEIVHLFLTGLHGIQSVPDEAPNPLDRLIQVADPPTLAEPESFDVLFFGLAPGLIGLEQLDVRIKRATTKENLWSDVSSFGCTPPPVLFP